MIQYYQKQHIRKIKISHNLEASSSSHFEQEIIYIGDGGAILTIIEKWYESKLGNKPKVLLER